MSMAKRFAIGVTIFAAGYFFGGFIEPDYECGDATHIAMAGESLWSIAAKNCTGDVRAAVDDMVEKYGPEISEGQLINLP